MPNAQGKLPVKKKEEMTEDQAERATLRGMKRYKYPCPACGGHRVVHLGNTVKLAHQNKVQCMSCGAISANNSREPEYNEFVNITQAKKILEAVLAEFEEEKTSFDEVITAAGTDPGLILEHVMPMAMEIQMNVFSRFGFDRSIYGIRHCLQELRKHSRDDVIANMLLDLRATICSPAHWAGKQRLADEKALRLKEEKARLEREEQELKIRLARERKERNLQQEKALEMELVLGDVNATDIVTEHPPTSLVLWPHTAVQLKVVAAAPKKFSWFFMQPADDEAEQEHTKGFWRDAKVKHPLTPAGDFYVHFLDEYKPIRRNSMALMAAAPEPGEEQQEEGLAYVPRNRVRLDGRMDDARLPGQAWPDWNGQYVHACHIEESVHSVERSNALRPWGGVRGKAGSEQVDEAHEKKAGGNHIQEYGLYSSFAGRLGVSMLVLPDVGSCDGAAAHHNSLVGYYMAEVPSDMVQLVGMSRMVSVSIVNPVTGGMSGGVASMLGGSSSQGQTQQSQALVGRSQGEGKHSQGKHSQGPVYNQRTVRLDVLSTVNCTALSPNGHLLAVGAVGSFSLWDMRGKHGKGIRVSGHPVIKGTMQQARRGGGGGAASAGGMMSPSSPSVAAKSLDAPKLTGKFVGSDGKARNRVHEHVVTSNPGDWVVAELDAAGDGGGEGETREVKETTSTAVVAVAEEAKDDTEVDADAPPTAEQLARMKAEAAAEAEAEVVEAERKAMTFGGRVATSTRQVHWSPCGRYLVVGSQDGTRVYEVKGGERPSMDPRDRVAEDADEEDARYDFDDDGGEEEMARRARERRAAKSKGRPQSREAEDEKAECACRLLRKIEHRQCRNMAFVSWSPLYESEDEDSDDDDSGDESDEEMIPDSTDKEANRAREREKENRQREKMRVALRRKALAKQRPYVWGYRLAIGHTDYARGYDHRRQHGRFRAKVDVWEFFPPKGGEEGKEGGGEASDDEESEGKNEDGCRPMFGWDFSRVEQWTAVDSVITTGALCPDNKADLIAAAVSPQTPLVQVQGVQQLQPAGDANVHKGGVRIYSLSGTAKKKEQAKNGPGADSTQDHDYAMLPESCQVTAMAWHPDGKQLCLAVRGVPSSRIHIWKRSKSAKARSIERQLKEGRSLAEDGSKLDEVLSPACWAWGLGASFDAHFSTIRSVDWSPMWADASGVGAGGQWMGGDWLASCGDDGTIKVWDPRGGGKDVPEGGDSGEGEEEYVDKDGEVKTKGGGAMVLAGLLEPKPRLEFKGYFTPTHASRGPGGFGSSSTAPPSPSRSVSPGRARGQGRGRGRGHKNLGSTFESIRTVRWGVGAGRWLVAGGVDGIVRTFKLPGVRGTARMKREVEADAAVRLQCFARLALAKGSLYDRRVGTILEAATTIACMVRVHQAKKKLRRLRERKQGGGARKR
jgi:WD40 repeat protein